MRVRVGLFFVMFFLLLALVVFVSVDLLYDSYVGGYGRWSEEREKKARTMAVEMYRSVSISTAVVRF